MDYNYDFNLNNRMLSIYDSATNSVYITRSFELMNSFAALVSSSNEATLDDSIHVFMCLHSSKLSRMRQS